jgi:hypothetical protein
MFASSGEITKPYGLAVFASDHMPSSITPAFTHFLDQPQDAGIGTRDAPRT